MTKQEEKELKRIARLRKEAGERVMYYDELLSNKLEEFGVDIASKECGLNSVFLITEPAWCEREAKKIIGELKNSNIITKI